MFVCWLLASEQAGTSCEHALSPTSLIYVCAISSVCYDGGGRSSVISEKKDRRLPNCKRIRSVGIGRNCAICIMMPVVSDWRTLRIESINVYIKLFIMLLYGSGRSPPPEWIWIFKRILSRKHWWKLWIHCDLRPVWRWLILGTNEEQNIFRARYNYNYTIHIRCEVWCRTTYAVNLNSMRCCGQSSWSMDKNSIHALRTHCRRSASHVLWCLELQVGDCLQPTEHVA